MKAAGLVKNTSELEDKSLWYLLGLRSSLGFRVIGLFIFPSALSPLYIDRATYGGS